MTKRMSVDMVTTKLRQLTRGGEGRGGLLHGNHLLDLSTTGGLYTKLLANTENREASWNRKEILKERKG